MSELTLSGNVGIAETTALKSELDALLNADAEISVRCRDLEYVDGSALQLLLAFTLEARRHGQKVVFLGECSALAEGVELMALTSQFELMSEV